MLLLKVPKCLHIKTSVVFTLNARGDPPRFSVLSQWQDAMLPYSASADVTCLWRFG